MFKRLTSLVLLCMLAIASYAQHLNEILSELSAPAKQSVLVVSHRGDWRNAPENSLQAFQNCIDMGVDMVELDLKKTKDGELILMHDNTLNRTTNGTGKPEDFTLAELKELRLKNGAGCLTRHKIPTLRETMLLCKGKILVNVDKGYEYFEDVQKILEETGTANQCVVKEKIPYQTIKEQHGDILDKVIFMPKADLCKPVAESIIDSYLQNEKPLAFEVRFSQVNDKVFELIKKLNDNGIKVFVNALWPAQNAEHDDDRAVELKQPDESWGWLIQQGFKLIQTDRPALLLDYLRAKKLHK